MGVVRRVRITSRAGAVRIGRNVFRFAGHSILGVRPAPVRTVVSSVKHRRHTYPTDRNPDVTRVYIYERVHGAGTTADFNKPELNKSGGERIDRYFGYVAENAERYYRGRAYLSTGAGTRVL